jgi:hypothetical protein
VVRGGSGGAPRNRPSTRPRPFVFFRFFRRFDFVRDKHVTNRFYIIALMFYKNKHDTKTPGG